MSKGYVILMQLIFGMTCAIAAEDWQNQYALHISTVKPHANMRVYENESDALKMTHVLSSRMQLLNGNWKFNWVASPDERQRIFTEAILMTAVGKPFRFRQIGRLKAMECRFIRMQDIRLIKVIHLKS